MSEHKLRVAELFAEALEIEPQGRSGYLALECAGDPLMLTEIKLLLELEAEAVNFLALPAMEVEARHLAAERADETRTGEVFSHYEILSLIGEGGMGEVYLAQDRELNRKVALKLVKGSFKTKEILRRFQNEREILASLEHANIARLLDGGTTADGLPFFVMEFVEGMPIDKYCDSNRLTIERRLKLFRSVCSAVQFAHQHLIVHRDLKPSNILITKDGTPKLLDFGIAKVLRLEGLEESPATAPEVRVMTPEYSSPEQVRGEGITTASDVYSLGVLMYELLTGRRPYRLKNRSPLEIARVISEATPERPSAVISRIEGTSRTEEATDFTLTSESISETRGCRPEKLRQLLRGDLDNIVLRAIRKEPQRRYASVEQFSEDIGRHIEGLPIIASSDTFAYRGSKFIKRHRVAVAAVGLAFLLLVGGILAIAWEAHAARIQRARAEQQFNDLRELAHSVLFDYHDAIATLPGSTPVRERLVKDSLKYLDRLAQESGNNLSLQQELAIAYIKVGDVQGRPATANLGDAKGALESYQKALAISQKLTGLDPKNMEIRRGLALAYGRLGEIDTLSGNPAKAVEQHRQSLAIFEEINAADPANAQYQASTAFAHRMLAQVLGVPSVANVGDVKGALEHLQKAVTIYQALPDRDSSSDLDLKTRSDLLVPISKKYRQENLAYVYEELASVLDVSGNKASGLESRQKSVSLFENLLAEDPRNILTRRNLAVGYGNLGSALLNAGDREAALARNRQALALYEALAAEDPKDLNARKDLALGYRNMGKTLAESKERTGAFSYYNKAVDIFNDLIAKDPNNAFLRRHLAYTYLRMSMLSSDGDDLKDAADQARQAISICESLVAADSKNATARNTLALSYSQLGETSGLLASKAAPAQQKNNWQAARNWYQKSLDIWLDMRNGGKLNGSDASKPEEVAREIAKCDTALSRLKK